LVAWLVASGISADALQVVAYADHAGKNIAISEKDHCGPCQMAEAAREASDHAAPLKQEVAKIKVKPDGAVWSVRLPSVAPSASKSFLEVVVSADCSELIYEVPVPPPEAAV
jgi:hypothetical protein